MIELKPKKLANLRFRFAIMGIKSLLVKPVAKLLESKVKKMTQNACADQGKILNRLLSQGAQTAFGSDHDLGEVSDHEGFKTAVPIYSYEDLRPYVNRIIEGEQDVLWPGQPRYFAKTSGTTSGVKYIPITKESVPSHFGTARNALFTYMARTGDSAFMDGKLMFLSGSPTLTEKGGIHTGRLSGISNHLIPTWLKGSQLPSYETNCIEDWETKLDAIIDETIGEDLRLISGIPPWVQMFYERLLERTGKQTVKEVFPNLSMFVYGGVNFEPYRARLESLVGERLPSVETYPASEGFIAFQDQVDSPDLLLNTNAGMYFEFVPADQYFNKERERLNLSQVKIGVDYAVILSTTAGLWGYDLGDTVRFVSVDPYRILVSGRIKHYISAFGEHVIGKEVEEALLEAAQAQGGSINECTVAPQVNPVDTETPYHEWFIACTEAPSDVDAFAEALDQSMIKQNIYYADLRKGNVLQRCVLRIVQPDAFRKYMETQGKLGGQNKVPRLSNDRKIANALHEYILKSAI